MKVCFGCKSIVSIGRKIPTLVGDSILLGWRTSHVKLFAGSFLEVVVLWELCLVHMELVHVEFAGNSHTVVQKSHIKPCIQQQKPLMNRCRISFINGMIHHKADF